MSITDAFPPDQELRLWTLAVHLRQLKDVLLYVDYAQAERDCEQLAARLRERLDAADLRAMAFYPVPRGGLIVLGMLAYVLDLQPGQIQPDAADDGRPLCIVDDCALTGYRFGQVLRRLRPGAGRGPITFAHLYSHPDLRAAVVAREPAVATALAARDLSLVAISEAPLAPSESQMHDYLGPDRYWTEPVRQVAFAWSEPNVQILDPVSGAIDDRWRLIPPHRCLRNRSELGLPAPPAPPTRQWWAPEHVAASWTDGVLWLINLVTERAFRLEERAADVWRGLAGYGSLATTRAWLLAGAAPGEQPAQARAIDALARTLLTAGLVARDEELAGT